MVPGAIEVSTEAAARIAAILVTAGVILGAGALLRPRLSPLTREWLGAIGYFLTGLGTILGFWALFASLDPGSFVPVVSLAVLAPVAVLFVIVIRSR